MLLHDRFDYYARARPDLTFAQHGDTTITYAEARTRANRIAHALLGSDLTAGDRVAYRGRNSVDAALLYFACSKAGIVPVPLNPALTEHEVDFIVEDAGARLTLDDEHAVDALLHAGDWPDDDPPHRAAPTDVLYQMYTSGTTGRPKGVLLTHQSVLTNCAQVCCGLSYTIEPGDRWLIVAPLFHAAAVITAFNCVFGGGTLVIQQGFDPQAVVDALGDEDITLTTLVPVMIRACLAVPGVDDRGYPRLRAIAYGGSVIDEQTLRRAMDVFGCDFYQGFGQTESSAGLTYLTELDHRRALDGRPELLRSCGQALPGTELRIVDPDTGADVPTGEVGEIVARGPQVMSGYWNRPGDDTLRDGWLHTGDAGSLDADGYLTIRDRIRDMVVTGGENVYPVEVERVLLEHPHVTEAAVIGVPDDRWGEAVHAVIVGTVVDLDDVRAHCERQLADFKRPKSYEVVDALPRNASGKVRKNLLREPHGKDA
jgi:acyl-CoA synthetase (AMP-forming)/AMP-acid ligase II